ncbi:hypothetical protein SS1G_04920 [Sclerotinia sclerotiorum 1980 UF-70]|uniref:Uncharacterized protein n=1 Tax=Sclerotinia sclerotiorum (strain ATCC 18683 / 1980 / Ss-1) TaxID=665079 RepID=A7EHX8_SCLS1|nr:hypothetical protein SS1G_04920 [Sclerotinia sclerotiorum 1980 UF-70]EDO02444.1 hypothetical protein SS1G_04920 [Sclerotinia sclerotiorum 1980 UF-70]
MFKEYDQVFAFAVSDHDKHKTTPLRFGIQVVKITRMQSHKV